MAFGFFKKTQAADTIFFNGHIYTHDPDFPWANAVACQDGRITAVGDYEAMEQMNGSDTQCIDLNGNFLFPGFIDVHRSPVLQVFDGEYLSLSGCRDKDELLGMVTDWACDHQDTEILFGYGFSKDLAPETEELDQCCQDRPVVLLSASGLGLSVNSAAEAIITQTAEEECVEVITTNYVLNLLVPFDFEVIEESVNQQIDQLCDQGITTVLNLMTPDYFESLYQDSLVGMYNEGQLKQRFFGSYLMNRPLQPRGLIYTLMRRKTNCTEMGNMMKAQTLNLFLDQMRCPMEFSQEALNTILLEVAEKGFDFFIEAISYEDLKKAYWGLEALRSRGYKNTVTIASDLTLKEEDLRELEKASEVLTTWGTDVMAAHPVAADVSSVSEAIDALTVDAAAIIGMEDELGKVEKGRLADFTIFEENPLSLDLRTFSRLHAVMTVVNGQVVYDVEEDNMKEMYQLLLNQHL